MKNKIGFFVVTAALLALVALAVGCSTTARAPDKDQYGAVESKENMDDALGNIDRVMGMGMDNAKPYMMGKTEDAMKMGKALFNNADLGNNGQSCNSCHPNGGTTGGETEIAKKMGHGPYKLPIPSLIGASARFPKYKVPNDEVITLAMMNNNCMRMFMKGKRLPLDSPESFYLAQYVTSLSNGDEVEVGKK